MKCFNTTGPCNSEKHYMVDITERLIDIKKLVDHGKYFTINRARQYGKTTTLAALAKFIQEDYYVLKMDFQGISYTNYRTEELFVKAFCRMLLKRDRKEIFPCDIRNAIQEMIDYKENITTLDHLFFILSDWCEISDRPVVLMIDEIDSAANNQIFLDFLAQLRLQYIEREENPDCPVFHSVILAGVTDIKYLKSKIRDEGDERVNSPWNIAADFKIDMSLSQSGIKGMLREYEKEHDIKMDTELISQYIYEQTSGYPYLVSRICQIIAEDFASDVHRHSKDIWSLTGVDDAVKNILTDRDSTLFKSLTGKLTNYPDMKNTLKRVLMEGISISYNADNEAINQMVMYGFIKNQNGVIAIANRIFETRLYNMFLSEEEIKNNIFFKEGAISKNIFVKDGRLNIRLIMERFIETNIQIFGPLEKKFKEKDGREQFLLYLKPIINGTGNYYIEAQTRNQTRTDVVVDYMGRQYVIELKIWHGPRYNEAGEKQLKEYLDYFNLDTGYMLSFNFNKHKETGVRRINIENKVLYEGIL